MKLLQQKHFIVGFFTKTLDNRGRSSTSATLSITIDFFFVVSQVHFARLLYDWLRYRCISAALSICETTFACHLNEVRFLDRLRIDSAEWRLISCSCFLRFRKSYVDDFAQFLLLSFWCFSWFSHIRELLNLAITGQNEKQTARAFN